MDKRYFEFTKLPLKIASILLLVAPPMIYADEHEEDAEAESQQHSARIYRNPEERREAGLGRHVTEWLEVRGLVELEDTEKEIVLVNDREVTENERPVLTLQLGLDFTISEWLTAELIFEAESDGKRDTTVLDEGFLSAEIDEWGLELGRQTVPFGEYYSHFVSGPLLEFGETTAETLIVDYTFDDAFELAGFVFESKADRQGDSDDLDWGARLEYASDDENVIVGASYLSDLAESDERLLREFNDQFQRRVPAWNAYALVGLDRFEITAELLRATKEFTELEAPFDKPSSYNVELAYSLNDSLQVATRYERIDEIEDEPAQRYGVAVTWALNKFCIISVDALFGKFKTGFAFDDDDIELSRTREFGIQLSAEF